MITFVLIPISDGSPKRAHFGELIDHRNSDGSVTRRVVMADGRSLPVLGFGTWQLGNDTTVKRALLHALDAGYRLIDTAHLYGNEAPIGEVLRQRMSTGRLSRADLFVTTKVWSNHHSKARVMKSIRDSLRKLQLDYLDLVLLHYPAGFRDGTDLFPIYRNGSIIPRTWQKDSYLEPWRAMEEAVRLGLVRSIGVSNFNRRQTRKLLSNAKVRPVLNQVESHPYLRQSKLRQYLHKRQVLMQAYAPLRRGDRSLLGDRTLGAIGRRHRKTAAQIALRWQIDRSVAVVVKSSNRARIRSNYNIFDFHLNQTEMRLVNGIRQKARLYGIPGLETHPDYPFNEE